MRKVFSVSDALSLSPSKQSIDTLRGKLEPILSLVKVNANLDRQQYTQLNISSVKLHWHLGMFNLTVRLRLQVESAHGRKW